MAGGFGFWAWFSDLPTLNMVLTALIAAVAFIWGINGLLWGREKLRKAQEDLTGQSQLTATVSDGNSKLADWMSTMMLHDREHLTKCVLVNGDVVFDNITDSENPDLTFRFDIYNGSIFTFRIRQPVEGHVSHQETPLIYTPELIQPASSVRIERTQRIIFELRQPLLPQAVDDILAKEGEQVVFRFNDLDVWIEAATPDGEPGPSLRLPLPDELPVTVPSRQKMRLSG